MDRLQRLMIFYDGAYYRKGTQYTRYHLQRGYMRFERLHAIIETYMAELLKISRDSVKTVDAHWYDGRLSAGSLDERQLRGERGFELRLVKEGITPHFLDMQEDQFGQNAAQQKGVDILLALDVFDYASNNRLDVAVLVTGDSDFVPLVRRVISYGKLVFIVHFNNPYWTDSQGYSHRPVVCSEKLLRAATHSMSLTHIIEDPNWEKEMGDLFIPAESFGRQPVESGE